MDLLMPTVPKFDAFTRAFARQNQHFETAIRSLDTLSEQIVQFVSETKFDDDVYVTAFDESCPSEESPLHQPWSRRCHYSMVLMRRLLMEAQGQFRKMMSDNEALATRIDQDIQTAHLQVSLLRAELDDTNQRLLDICATNNVMAGNVITTCMPPTSTTNTVVTSSVETHWTYKDSGPKASMVDKKPRKEGEFLQLGDSKVPSQGHIIDTVVTKGNKSYADKLPQFSASRSSGSGSSSGSHGRACPRQGSKEALPRPTSKDRTVESLKRSEIKTGMGRISPPSGYGKPITSDTDPINSPQMKSKVENEVKDGNNGSQKSFPPPSKRGQQNHDTRGSLARDDSTASHAVTAVQITPVPLTNSELKQEPDKKTSPAETGLVSAETNVQVSSVIHKTVPGDSPSKYKEQKAINSRQLEPSSSWAEFESAGGGRESQGDHPLSKGTPENKPGSDKDARPSNCSSSWCSDTGDSVSDILTSDECMRDQNEIPEAERLAQGFSGKLPGSEDKQCINDQVNGGSDCGKGSLEYPTYRGQLDAQKQQFADGMNLAPRHVRPSESDAESLKIKCSALQRDLEEVMESRDEKAKENAAMAAQLDRVDKELKHSKEALAALKQDRKRLKAEKFDLLTQMKQLYSTLEDKENELREFIRNYEQKMKESDETTKQLRREREELEKEKWSILQRARDEAERCVLLCTQIGLKDAHIKELQEELAMFREKHLISEQDLRQQPNGYGSPGSVSYRTLNGIDSRGTPTPTPGSDPTSSYAGTPTMSVIQYSCAKDSGKGNYEDLHHRPALLSRSAEDIFNSTPAEDGSHKASTVSKKSKEKKGTWGSISRVFSRNKHRRKALDPDLFQNNRSSWSPKGSVCSSSPLSEESYHQKLRLLEETHGTPMQHWRAATVLAWLEITMDMPQYGTMCAENIKSGKVLLELSDVELEEGLGISNVMHRRKLRLAIEEHREPALCRYPKVCLMTHSWVVEEWLPTIAMSCYLPSFSEHSVDGRVLDTLTKKDLEKYFGITRKFHQMSIIHGIQLLRMLNFDRQVLNQRRMNSENMDVDPLVWTNQRFIKWATSIDLSEYAENLRNSGVHGALVVLETSFSAETMATALGIPASKNIIRRHLTTEWQSLIQPARLSLESESVVAKKSKGERRLVSGSSSTSLASQGGKSSGGLVQSYARRTLDRYDRRRTSWRFSTWRSSQESLKSTSSKKAAQTPTTTTTTTTAAERPRLLPLSPKLNSNRHRRTFSSHSDVETLTVTPV